MRDHLPYLNIWIVFFVLACVITIPHFLFESSIIDVSSRLYEEADKQWLISLSIIAGLTIDIFLPVPSSVFSIWAASSMSLPGAFLTIWTGMNLACLLGYTLGASSNKALSRKCLPTRELEKAHTFSARHGMLALATLRAVPVLAEVSVVAAGISRMPIRQFIISTSLANTGIAILYVCAGTYLEMNHSLVNAIMASVTFPIIGWLGCYLLSRNNQVKYNKYDISDKQISSSFTLQLKYPLLFSNDIFNIENNTLALQINTCSKHSTMSALFVIDSNVLKAQQMLSNKIESYCSTHNINKAELTLMLPGGEEVKTQQYIEKLHRSMLEQNLDRHCWIVAIGGGALLDCVGYAASTFHRGIKLIRIPTTVLSQNDAGIGVKNGINAYGIKNLLGCFSTPHAVINDSHFLTTLSQRQFRSGFSEAIKVALIRDERFFYWIEKNTDNLINRTLESSNYLIKQCAQLHLNQICLGGDPFEKGSARPLDFGHWCAHKLESLSHYTLSHGEAVAIGMALDTLYSVEVNLLQDSVARRILKVLTRLGFDLWHDSLNTKTPQGLPEILNGLEEFRQHLGGQLCITLLTGIGSATEVNVIDNDVMLRACNRLNSTFSDSKQG